MIDLEKYRDKLLAKGFDEYIGFYTREFFCLDNFSAFKIDIEGILFSTVEHAYQAYKFIETSSEIFLAIVNAKSPIEAKQIAHNNEELIDPNWNNKKIELMEMFLRIKLHQHPYVKKKLLETKNYIICEDSLEDSFWGIGPSRDGENMMGKLWMKIRSELTNLEIPENQNMKIVDTVEVSKPKTENASLTKVTIYTDGACSGNPGKGGWGAVLFCKNTMKEISGYCENTTNNQMELTAAIEALNKLKVPCEVDLYSDSAYLINAFNEKWVDSWILNGFKNANKKPVSNVDLWQKLIEFNSTHKIKWIKVKGHSDNKYNNRCDELATGEIAKHS